MDQKFLTVSEVAQRMHCSEDSIRRYADSESLPAIRVGKGQRLFQETDVDRFAAARANRKRKAGAGV